MKPQKLKYDKFDLSDAGKYSAHEMIVKAVGKNKRVLEIGCATGYISQMLKLNECHVTGIEIDGNAGEIARNICDEVIIGDVEVIELPQKEYDVILFGDVLEHLKNPENVLKKAMRNLKERGEAVISVPNIANWKIRLSLLFGKFNYTDIGILDRTHLRFFTYKSIKRLISSTNLKIVSEDITPSFPFPFSPFIKYKLAKLWKKLFALQFIFICEKEK